MNGTKGVILIKSEPIIITIPMSQNERGEFRIDIPKRIAEILEADMGEGSYEVAIRKVEKSIKTPKILQEG